MEVDVRSVSANPSSKRRPGSGTSVEAAAQPVNLSDGRPDHDAYFMGIALAVRKRAVCLGRHVGAVLVRDGRIISTGYNGTPDGMAHCDDREHGCVRCKDQKRYRRGEGYDVCICVHAEQNALLAAARFGNVVESATMYSTVRPCVGCTKEAVQAKLYAVRFLWDWEHRNPKVQAQYELLQARLPGGVRPVAGVEDPEGQPDRPVAADTGHEPEELTAPLKVGTGSAPRSSPAAKSRSSSRSKPRIGRESRHRRAPRATRPTPRRPSQRDPSKKRVRARTAG